MTLLAFRSRPREAGHIALISFPLRVQHGWSLPYTLGVLGRWKMAAVYCQAVLSHDQRIALDGAPAETVDAEAKDLAAKQLARLAARKAKKAAEAAAPAVVRREARHIAAAPGHRGSPP